MRLYRWFLVIAIIIIVLVYAYPRVLAHAEPVVSSGDWVMAQPPLPALIATYSALYGVSSTSLANLVWSESGNDPLADNGVDRGIAQISRVWHPEVSDKCAFDTACALDWAAQRIKAGYGYEWTSGNCYSYVSMFVRLPKMSEVLPSKTLGLVKVAIFDYRGVKHVALVTSSTQNGFWVQEANYKPFKIGPRFITWGDKALIGFWSPNNS